MKKRLLLLLIGVAIGFTACEDDNLSDDRFADYEVARPLTLSIDEFRNGVDVVAPRAISESGKIYAYQNYIFVNDKYRGIHVIDNSEPTAPQKIAFITIPGNVDISVKNNFLFADSITDLVVLDITDINNVREVNRLNNVLQDNIVWPFEADIVEYEGIDYQNEIVIGWETTTERRLIADVSPTFFEDAVATNAEGNATGQGGSLARFKIVDDYLYAVDSHNINVFNIENLENPESLEDVYAGFDIETIFNRGDHLFLGSMRGMYIFDISNRAVPSYVSEFEHGTACDPVVVDENYAYVTLRGGNSCGAIESGLFIIDISDINTPELVKTYPMDEPFGLGIKDEKLFICDGASGLKVYDKSNIENLIALDHFDDIVTFDVIPLNEKLLMVGEEVLYQYRYSDNSIVLLSTLKLN